MWTVYRNEMNKNFTPTKTIVLGLIFILLTFFIVLIEKMYVFAGYNPQTVINELLIYNLNFALIKLIIPMAIISFVALSFSAEYSSGVMKYSLLSGTSRGDLLLGKWMYLFSLNIILWGFCFFVLIFTGLTVFKDSVLIINQNFYSVAYCYILVSLGMLVMILLTITIFMFIDNFGGNWTIGVMILYFFISIDSIARNIILFSPTTLISYSYLALDTIENVRGMICFSLVYIILLLVLNIWLFKRKDILL